MNKSWLKRIERLEAMVRPHTPLHAVFRYGYVRRFPAQHGMERHVVATNVEPTTLACVEHCEFEERMGPAPGLTPDLCFTVYLQKDAGHDSSPSP
jgi:hypothetical protein